MNRLWYAAAVLCVAGGLALGSSLAEPRSMWPGVVLFCAAGMLAVVATALEASAETARHEATLDADERYERIRQQSEEAFKHAKAIDLIALSQLQADVEFLKKSKALEGF
jgi:hypothetical protein